MATALATAFVPPVPMGPEGPRPWYRVLRDVRSNALNLWGPAAYREGVLAQRFFGRTRILLNDPAAIHHVLVDNTANYRRSPATVRILRPIVGDGLFLSEGESWKHQRRTIAPALAPRVIPMLCHHIADATAEALVQIGRAHV